MTESPPIWLLGKVRDGEAELTQTHALNRKIVREAAERWPDWWGGADLFEPTESRGRGADRSILHEGCKRLKRVRRRARKLQITKLGRELLVQPGELKTWFAGDLGAQHGFTAAANEVVAALSTLDSPTLDELTTLAHAAVLRQSWRDLDGNARRTSASSPGPRPPAARDTACSIATAPPGAGP